jgi:hypothetical protein
MEKDGKEEPGKNRFLFFDLDYDGSVKFVCRRIIYGITSEREITALPEMSQIDQ